jgi:hypothetical protein
MRQVLSIDFSIPLIVLFVQTLRQLLSSQRPFPVQQLPPIVSWSVASFPASLDQPTIHQLLQWPAQRVGLLAYLRGKFGPAHAGTFHHRLQNRRC